jgi:exonuclease VII small subunit
MKKNALDYHRELSELENLIASIEYSLDYIKLAYNHLDENISDLPSMALALAENDLRKSYETFKKRHDKIVHQLAKTYFE